jgi:hypothetical protein
MCRWMVCKKLPRVDASRGISSASSSSITRHSGRKPQHHAQDITKSQYGLQNTKIAAAERLQV